ncbi:MAG: hypothetical protein KDD04_05170 [Sinomicrobium sp.]|nr:hypothetical protein [Sinomicrobium sp.]
MYYPKDGGTTFINQILVNPYIKTAQGGVAKRTPEQIRISERHEKIHAIQWDSIPALHASPYNQATPVVLSPESWVLMTILTEREAFTKTAWLNALELSTAHSEELSRQAQTETLTPGDINLQSADIRQALQDASTAWDKRLKHKANPKDADINFLDHYIEQALDAYEQSNRLNARAMRAPVFVRLSADDILAIGSGFGPSTFGNNVPDDIFTYLPQMRPDLWQRLQDLNRKHGIVSEAGLPTFKDTLQNMGLTPDAYMAESKAHIYNPDTWFQRRQDEQSYEIQVADNTPAL